MTRGEILHAAEQCVSGQRQEDYGTPEDNFAIIAAFWSTYLGYPVDSKDVALMMALLKIARSVTGKGSPDNYVDLAGYAACAGEIVTRDNGLKKEGAMYIHDVEELAAKRGIERGKAEMARSLLARSERRDNVYDYEKLIADLNAMIPAIHQNAVDHGWWEGDRSFWEIYSLFHSELSEALEEYRNGEPVIYCNQRGGDWCPNCCGDACAVAEAEGEGLGDRIAVLHCALSVAWLQKKTGGNAAADYDELTLLSAAVKEIAAYTALHGHELPVIVTIKHAFNVTRSYKHGGKVI